MIILRHTTLCGRVTSLTQRHLHNKTQHSKETSISVEGFEPAIPTLKRPQTQALQRATTRIVGNRTIKVKWSRYRPGVAQRMGRGIALLFHDRGTRRGWVVSSTPRPHFTPGKDPVHILQEAGWAPGPVWTGGKSRPTGIRSRTLQPVVSHYTNWATRPT